MGIGVICFLHSNNLSLKHWENKIQSLINRYNLIYKEKKKTPTRAESHVLIGGRRKSEDSPLAQNKLNPKADGGSDHSLRMFKDTTLGWAEEVEPETRKKFQRNKASAWHVIAGAEGQQLVASAGSLPGPAAEIGWLVLGNPPNQEMAKLTVGQNANKSYAQSNITKRRRHGQLRAWSLGSW